MSVQFWPGAHFDFGRICAILEKPMNEQERKMLEEVVELSRDNNIALRKLVRYHRRTVILHAIYWSIIIGSTIVVYYSVQPYVGVITKFFTGRDFSGIINAFNALPSR